MEDSSERGRVTLWTARFWDQKVSYCYTVMVFYSIFWSFLISWANCVLLRVAVCKDWESAVSDPFGESLIFCPKLALGRLFSKIIFKSSNDFVYLWNLGKIKSTVKMRSKCGFLVDQKVRWWTSAEVLKWNQLTSKLKEFQSNQSSTLPMF